MDIVLLVVVYVYGITRDAPNKGYIKLTLCLQI